MTPELIPDDQLEDADDYVLGYVWPSEKTVFPDFLNPRAKDWWINEIITFSEVIEFTCQIIIICLCDLFLCHLES